MLRLLLLDLAVVAPTPLQTVPLDDTDVSSDAPRVSLEEMLRQMSIGEGVKEKGVRGEGVGEEGVRGDGDFKSTILDTLSNSHTLASGQHLWLLYEL